MCVGEMRQVFTNPHQGGKGSGLAYIVELVGIERKGLLYEAGSEEITVPVVDEEALENAELDGFDDDIL